VDTQSPRVWCQTNNVGHIRDTLLTEAKENIENWLEDILVHIRDLIDSIAFSNLLLEYSKSKNSENESTQPFIRWFIEYIDKSCQTYDPNPRKEQVKLMIKYIPTEYPQQILLLK